jgi:hypothetical protein
MRRIMWAALCLAIPGLLFLNAWQGFRYNDLSDKVAALEKVQKDLLEKNRDVIAQIAYETSPERVGQKAALAEGLIPLDQSALTRLQVDAAPQGGSAQ